jgi:hypothetical protein
MKSSSARQLEPDSSDEPISSPSAPMAPTAEPIDATRGDSASFKAPDFGKLRDAYITTARIAGRLNAANTSEEEYRDLLRERQVLLDKKFAETITPAELNKLALVRWSLDRIDDARTGIALDDLESAVARYEQLLKDIEELGRQIKQQMKGEGSDRGRNHR